MSWVAIGILLVIAVAVIVIVRFLRKQDKEMVSSYSEDEELATTPIKPVTITPVPVQKTTPWEPSEESEPLRKNPVQFPLLSGQYIEPVKPYPRVVPRPTPKPVYSEPEESSYNRRRDDDISDDLLGVAVAAAAVSAFSSSNDDDDRKPFDFGSSISDFGSSSSDSSSSSSRDSGGGGASGDW